MTGAGEDLSQGALSAMEVATANLGLEEHAHRINLQRTLANSALAFVALLFMCAAGFTGVLIYLIAGDSGGEIHWHASILAAAFVVPPTIIMVALLRAVYSKSEKESDPAPALAFIKEVLSSIAEIFKK